MKERKSEKRGLFPRWGIDWTPASPLASHGKQKVTLKHSAAITNNAEEPKLKTRV